jgi:site-specific recombinase XerD
VSWQQLVEQFLVHCDVERGLCANTLMAYRQDLTAWRSFLDRADLPASPSEVTPQLVRQYVAHLKGKGLANVSIERRINGLRSFWRFLVLTETVGGSPLSGLTLPKKPRHLAAYLTEDELASLLVAAAGQSERFRAVRDTAVLATFVYAGLRRQELLDLLLPDVSLGDATLRVVRGKGCTRRPKTAVVLGRVENRGTP